MHNSSDFININTFFGDLLKKLHKGLLCLLYFVFLKTGNIDNIKMIEYPRKVHLAKALV
jgi:hypothetical protein